MKHSKLWIRGKKKLRDLDPTSIQLTVKADRKLDERQQPDDRLRGER